MNTSRFVSEGMPISTGGSLKSTIHGKGNLKSTKGGKGNLNSTIREKGNCKIYHLEGKK